MLASFSSNLELEIQQRAVEFGSLFSKNDVKMGVLERMPPPEIRATIMGTVSERRSVGSTRTNTDTVDLIGDDLSAPNSAGVGASNGASKSGPSTQDLLADIFGSSDDTATAVPAGAAQQGRNANADIMSLFGGSSTTAPAPTQVQGPTGGSGLEGLFDMPSTSAPVQQQQQQPQPPAQAQAPQQQGYPAYDKHGLRISITPRTSPNHPGVVQMMVRFVASEVVENVNFQVAVPKVSITCGICAVARRISGARLRRSKGTDVGICGPAEHSRRMQGGAELMIADSTASAAGNVVYDGEGWQSRDAANAHYCACGGTLLTFPLIYMPPQHCSELLDRYCPGRNEIGHWTIA